MKKNIFLISYLALFNCFFYAITQRNYLAIAGFLCAIVMLFCYQQLHFKINDLNKEISKHKTGSQFTFLFICSLLEQVKKSQSHPYKQTNEN